MNKPFLNQKVRSALRWIGWVLLVQFILVNISAALYAHKFSHFYNDQSVAANFAKKNILKKTWRLFTGPRFPKSVINESPSFPYETIKLTTQKGIGIEAWYAKTDSTPLGTVILFHGLTLDKATCLTEAYEFRYQGYNVMLVDFRAHGNSDGNNTSIGFRESEEVKLAYDFAVNKGGQNIFLWGVSMGAVTISKAISDYNIKPTGIILETPFESLKSHLRAKVRANGFSGYPERPFGFLVTCWMSIERGFNGFNFKTDDYAKKINCPVLMQWGAKDHIVLKYETERVFNALNTSNKKLVIYENADHESFLQKDPLKWRIEVEKFLKDNSK